MNIYAKLQAQKSDIDEFINSLDMPKLLADCENLKKWYDEAFSTGQTVYTKDIPDELKYITHEHRSAVYIWQYLNGDIDITNLGVSVQGQYYITLEGYIIGTIESEIEDTRKQTDIYVDSDEIEAGTGEICAYVTVDHIAKLYPTKKTPYEKFVILRQTVSECELFKYEDDNTTDYHWFNTETDAASIIYFDFNPFLNRANNPKIQEKLHKRIWQAIVKYYENGATYPPDYNDVIILDDEDEKLFGEDIEDWFNSTFGDAIDDFISDYDEDDFLYPELEVTLETSALGRGGRCSVNTGIVFAWLRALEHTHLVIRTGDFRWNVYNWDTMQVIFSVKGEF